MVWEVLDAILRATTKLGAAGGEEVVGGVVERDVGRGRKGVRKWREWDARMEGKSSGERRNLWKEVEEGRLVCESLSLGLPILACSLERVLTR